MEVESAVGRVGGRVGGREVGRLSEGGERGFSRVQL
jgi:hypothetical protein